MTIYSISVLTNTGYPYCNLIIKNLPKGIKLYLRFFDFTQNIHRNQDAMTQTTSFELNAGLISALFEFAKNMDKNIRTLEFISRSEDDHEKFSMEHINYEGNVLITAQTETYLLHKSIEKKIKLIYNTVISLKVPLDNAEGISKNEEQKIIDILTDSFARNHFKKKQNKIDTLATTYLYTMREYGLKCIALSSFDLSLIKIYGEKYSQDDIEEILRNIGEIPDIPALEWKYRQSIHKNNPVWVFLINSGVGVTVDGLFEPFYYLLFADPQSYFGEFPGKLTTEFNVYLG